ncbi:MAG: hypothetical protein HY000_10735 [Planctomycetes bacterium]|nr:hypothetical protein [Planctomycetota bacterium]
MKTVPNKLSAWTWLLVVTTFTATAYPAYPDIVVLRGGAEIEGLILDHRCDDSQVVIRARNKDVPIPKTQAVESKHKGTVQERYQHALKAFGDQLEDQWQLALWCQANGLSEQQTGHVKRCLEIDSDFTDASRMLHRLDEERLAKPQAKDLTKPGDDAADKPEADAPAEDSKPGQSRRDSLEQARQRQEMLKKEQEMTKTVQRLAIGLESKNADQVQNARAELAKLRDPLAVRPLLLAMETVSEPNRIRLLETIEAIPDAVATYALAVASLIDQSDAVRSRAVELLADRQKEKHWYMPVFEGALGSGRVGLIYNASDAVAELKEKQAVPSLIGALVTPVRTGFIRGEATLSYQELVSKSYLDFLDLANVARKQHRTRFDLYEMAKAGKIRFTGSDIYVPRIRTGSSITGRIGIMRSPAPIGAGPGGGSVSTGGTAPPPQKQATTPSLPRFSPDAPLVAVTKQNQRKPEPSSVVSMHQHEPVLVALRRLTDQDFGYDQEAWVRWLLTGGAEMLGIHMEDLLGPETPDLPKKAAAAPGKGEAE